MSLASSLAAALDPVAFARARSFYPEPWQARLLRSTEPRIAVPCARQTGKTTTTTIKALHTALHVPARDVLIISPSQRQSSEMLTKIAALYRGMAGVAAFKKDNATELVFQNDARIVSLPGIESTVRGFANVRLLIIDEAARVGDDIFASVLPMVGDDGQILALSTPWGQRGFFFEICEGEGSAWEKHRVTVYDSKQWDDKRISETKATVGSFVFRSDYEALFEDTTEQLFATADIRRAFSDDIQPLFDGGF